MISTAGSTTSSNVQFRLVSSGTTTTYTGDGTSGLFLWGAQLEAGAFATSYIPTVASQVTRTADQTSIVAPNFAPWYNQSEGTFVVSGDLVNGTFFPSYVSANDGTGTNEIYVTQVSSTVRAYLRSSSGAAGDLEGPAWAQGTVGSAALAYQLNNTGLTANGGAVIQDTAVGIPTVDRLSIGVRANGTNFINGHIRSIRYYPTRLTNAQLQALTT
jgi:hypothetical protein